MNMHAFRMNNWNQRCSPTSLLMLFRVFLFSLLPLGLMGCASNGAQNSSEDPLEPYNRWMHNFNMEGDRILIKPLAQMYDQTLPGPVKTGVRNFYNNLREPATIVNDLLQGKPDKAAKDTLRFLFNTTFGMLGLIDIASYLGLPRQVEDFGQTLAVWGVPAGPYFVLPFLGPSTIRDSFGVAAGSIYTDPLNELESPEKEYASVLRLLSIRAELLPADKLLEAQPDQYLFIREAWRQRRERMIHDSVDDPDESRKAEEALIGELLEE
ncbi:MAG: VacJ family lipoprotein [Gammaproteobacteria bacterium]|nr:VacJ family lipoprotein [Gammaproteobacteria bacterium]